MRLDVPDRTMSSRHAILFTQGGKWLLRDAQSKNGTVLNGRRVERAQLKDSDFFQLGGSFFVYRDSDSSAWPESARCFDSEGVPEADLQTFNGALRRAYQRLSRVARARVPIMVFGETGTGKELAARAVHTMSSRPGPFVAVNCAALSKDIVESELFGHRKGAFSGASESRQGVIRSADRGTLFLDEIGELRPLLQAKLLRVLQEGEVQPVGETRPVKVDVRIVSATQDGLARRIAQGAFRDDFYGRLAGYEVVLPALRERKEDLGLIIRSIVTRIVGGDRAIRLHPDAVSALFSYWWPRNIRELEHALGAAAALTDDGKVRLHHLPQPLRDKEGLNPPAQQPEVDNALLLRLTTLLKEHRGNVSAVARELGKARVQIRRWCKRFDIEPESFRED